MSTASISQDHWLETDQPVQIQRTYGSSVVYSERNPYQHVLLPRKGFAKESL